jgi:3'-phosphoadenosine 5'-phosphosulfate sulfotransferase (PAPS reductase)/FAD synthetase
MEGELAAAPEPAEASFWGPIVDLVAYSNAVGPVATRFAATGSYADAVSLSKAILNAVIDHGAKDAGIAISCSWGKDSTLMVALLAEVLMERKTRGATLRPVFLVVAHTGNEFPEIEARIREQNSRLEAWGVKVGVSITTQVVGPAAKDSLIALLAGAGYALPKYSSSATATSAQWCVDRLKAGPIEAALEAIRARGSRMLHFLGVRSDESAKRSATIARLTEGLPAGLSRISLHAAGGGGVDSLRLAVQPIAHWSHEALKTYLKVSFAVWDWTSFETLKAFYRKGADQADLDDASECSIVRTPEGGFSNMCTQLGSARFGCTICVQSRNKSLINIAARDPRYKWVNAVHKYIYSGIAKHKRRMAEMAAHEFSNANMFCKGHTFRWRYTLLMFLFRAELESGLTLVTPEVEDAVRAHWERSGIYAVLPADARRDAARWKETGRLKLWYEEAAPCYEDLGESMADGVPAGSYAYLRNPAHFNGRARLALPNMLALVGRVSTIFPLMRAYVFRDKGKRGGTLTMLTDVPSDMGKKLNTDAASGYEGFALTLIGVRELTAWEERLMRGRILYYRLADGELINRLSRDLGRPFIPGQTGHSASGLHLRSILYANQEFLDECASQVFEVAFTRGHRLAQCRGRITLTRLRRLLRVVQMGADASDVLSEAQERFFRRYQRNNSELLADLRSVDKGGYPDRLAAVAAAVRQAFDLESTLPVFDEYVRIMRAFARWVSAGWCNTTLINHLAYIARTDRYDPPYAEELLTEVMRTLKLVS